MNRATQEQVIAAVRGERDYQDGRWPGHAHSLTEFLVFIDHYVKEAMDKVSVENGEDVAKHATRKIAALAIAAMEQNGFLPRTVPDTDSKCYYPVEKSLVRYEIPETKHIEEMDVTVPLFTLNAGLPFYTMLMDDIMLKIRASLGLPTEDDNAKTV
jgi:hypothetical protein